MTNTKRQLKQSASTAIVRFPVCNLPVLFQRAGFFKRLENAFLFPGKKHFPQKSVFVVG
jgi:hypothetical protein